MRPNELIIKDRRLFDKFLKFNQHELAVYAFANIYIWKGLFKISWLLIKDNLCVFFRDKMGCFLYLPPQGRVIKPEVVIEAFRIMDKFNKNKEVSRIENIEAADLSFYQQLGYICQEKFPDYLCKRMDLVQLKGSRFKHKRSAFNYFTKHYSFEYQTFSLRHKADCLKLYDSWMSQRQMQNEDPIYQGMLRDSQLSLMALLDNYADLGVLGRIVRIDRKIKGFTFGFKISSDTFCVLYEITDLSIKGVSQFIFQNLCSELKEHKYINIMDDSGLEGLRRVKTSYRPIKLIPAYVAVRR